MIDTCRRGHERTEKNTLIKRNGYKECKICKAMSDKAKPESQRKRENRGVPCLCRCGKLVENKWGRCRESRMHKCPHPKCTNMCEPTSKVCHDHRGWLKRKQGAEA